MCPKETDVTPGVESSLAPGLVEGRKCYPSRSEYAGQTAAAAMVWPELLASPWSRPSYHSCLHHKPHIFFPITLLLELHHLTTQNECTTEPSNQLLGNLRYHFWLFCCWKSKNLWEHTPHLLGNGLAFLSMRKLQTPVSVFGAQQNH